VTVIPGGESTVMLKLLNEFGMFDAVKQFGASGMPFFGTCAGCIMMARSIDVDEAMQRSIQPDQATLALADYSVTRNAYGAQVCVWMEGVWGGIDTPIAIARYTVMSHGAVAIVMAIAIANTLTARTRLLI